MARNSPLALSRRAASLLVYLGAPLVLLTGCTQVYLGGGWMCLNVWKICSPKGPMLSICAIIPCADPAVWISSVHDPHVELSLHCIDYVVETTPTSLSHRVLNLVHSLQLMQSKLLWIKKCLSIEDGGCLTPRILTVLISSVGREQSTQHFVGTLLLLSTQSDTLKTYMGLQFSLTNRYLSCRIHDATRQWEPQIVWASCITNILMLNCLREVGTLLPRPALTDSSNFLSKSNRSNTNDQDWTGHDNLAFLAMLQGRLPAKHTVDLTWQTGSPDNSGTSVWKFCLPQHVHQWKDQVEATGWSTGICPECQQELSLN